MVVISNGLLPRKRNKRLKEKDDYIRQNRGIEPAMLADDLGVTERFVVQRQRKLGLRLCCNTPRKGTSKCALLATSAAGRLV